MGHKDITFKEILIQTIESIARNILKLDIKVLDLISNEMLRIEDRQLDILFIAEDKDKLKVLIHIESQSKNDKYMIYRMLRYYCEIKFKYPDTPLYQYLIYTGKKKLSMKDNLVDTNINFRYTIIDMRMIESDYFLNQNNADLVLLAILGNFGKLKDYEIIEKIISKLKKLNLDKNELLTQILKLEIISTERDLEEKVKEVSENMLKTIRDLPSFKEGKLEGELEGIEKGKAEGKAEGKQKSKIEIAQNMLSKGFEIKVISEITGLKPEEIEKLEH